MSIQFKYSLTGICHFDNFPENLATNQFFRKELGMAGGVTWYANLRKYVYTPEIYPIIECQNENPKVKHGIRVYYSVLDRYCKSKITKDERLVLAHDKVSSGPNIQIMDLLDRKKKFLTGTEILYIRYGIHVESILEYDGIWKFNFRDHLIDEKTMTLDDFDEKYYCPKQLLSFHSPQFKDDLSLCGNSENIHNTLQIAHGVRLILNIFEVGIALKHSRKYGLLNVKRYCEQRFIELSVIHNKTRFHHSFHHNLTHLLASSLKRAKTADGLLKALKTSNVEKMSSGMMKMIIASCVYGKFLDY